MTTTSGAPRLALSRDEALAFVERAETAQDMIDELSTNGRNNGSLIAAQHQERDLCADLAQVHALLAIADAIDVLYIGLVAERAS